MFTTAAVLLPLQRTHTSSDSTTSSKLLHACNLMRALTFVSGAPVMRKRKSEGLLHSYVCPLLLLFHTMQFMIHGLTTCFFIG